MKINANEIRVGMLLEYKDDLWQVLKTQHVKPGMVEDLEAVQKHLSPEETEEVVTDPEENLTTGQMSEIRDILSKSKGEDHD